jgi:hypothetical protein
MASPAVTPVLPSPKGAKELLDMFYLDMRCALLETAAALDRIERAEGGAAAFRDPRLQKLLGACDLLTSGQGNRAEQFLRLFSE